MPKKNYLIALPYLGKLLLQIRTRINRVTKDKTPHCNFWIVFETKCKLIIFFAFRDKIPVFIRSVIVNKFKHDDRIATYHGKTKCHFKVRMWEHFEVSAFTIKKVIGDNDSAIKGQNLFCNHISGFNDFSILASNNNDFKFTLMESLLIDRDYPHFE